MEPVIESTIVGTLHLMIQSTDGRLLQAQLEVGIRPKLEGNHRKRRQAVEPVIIYCAPESEDRNLLEHLIEDKIGPFGAYLDKYRNALDVTESECAYWGEGFERDGISYLTLEINVAHPQVKRLFQACHTVEERIEAKERFVRDIVLDCYQHHFKLEDLPETAHEQVLTDPDDGKRAAEICLNHDKALRMAISEREKNRGAKIETA